jgi:hypothetical protein
MQAGTTMRVRAISLRGVAGGVAEEARIRGFPSPPLGEFGFVVVIYSV